MYLLDTDILVGFLRNDPHAISKIQTLLKEGGIGYISSINIHEIIKGAHLSKNTEKNLEKIRTLVQSLNLLSFNDQNAFLSGKLSAEQEKKGIFSTQNDMFIAAVAVQNQFILITRNKKYFENIEGLQIEEW